MPSPRHRRARGGPPLPATRVGCSEGSGSALRPAWKGVAVDPPGLREWSSHSEPPWGWGGHTRSPTGVGRGQGPQGPQAAQPGWAAGAPVGPRRALSAAARLWEGASPGTRWRGKGGIAGARHAERPRSACIAAGGGVAAPATPRVPPAPAPAAGRHPRRRARAPRSPPPLSGGGSLRLTPQSPGRSSCRKWLPKRRQSPRCHGRGAGAAAHPQPRSPSLARGLSARAPGPWRAPGEQGPERGRARRGRGGYLPAEGTRGGGWQEDSVGRTRSVCPPPCMPRALTRSRLPGGEMLMDC